MMTSSVPENWNSLNPWKGETLMAICTHYVKAAVTLIPLLGLEKVSVKKEFTKVLYVQ